MVKHNLSIITLGATHAGKSTFWGRLLFDLGGFSQRQVEKIQREAKEEGKNELCGFAYFHYRTRLEKTLGKTVVNYAREFYTSAFHYTLLDAPGDCKFMKSMIYATSQCQTAILIADCNEYDKSLPKTHAIYQHLMVCKALGVIQQIICCVTKMDDVTIGYDEQKYTQMKSKLAPVLDSFGFDALFIPTSAFYADNIVQLSKNMPWYKGETVIGALNDWVKPPTQQQLYKSAPFLMYLFAAHMIKGVGYVCCGHVLQGECHSGQIVRVPQRQVTLKLFAMETHHRLVESAVSGQNIGLNLKGIQRNNLPKRGEVLMLDSDSVKYVFAHYFIATMRVVNGPKQIRAGYEVSMHIVSERVQCQIVNIYWKKADPVSGVISKYPSSIAVGDTAQIMFKAKSAPIAIYDMTAGYNPIMTKTIGLDWNTIIMYGEMIPDYYGVYHTIVVEWYIKTHIEQALKLSVNQDIKHIVCKFVTFDKY